MNSTRNVVRAIIAFAALVLAGCVSGPNMTWLPAGAISTDMILPVQAAVTGAEGVKGPGLRQGTASCTAVLFIAAWGDCSVQAAATAGGITNIRTVDWRYTSYVVPIYYKYTLIVSGD